MTDVDVTLILTVYVFGGSIAPFCGKTISALSLSNPGGVAGFFIGISNLVISPLNGPDNCSFAVTVIAGMIKVITKSDSISVVLSFCFKCFSPYRQLTVLLN